MKAQEFEKHSKELIDHCWELLFSKAKEYASEEDRLANFKQPTTLFGVSAPEICLYYDSKHIASMVMIAQDISKGKLPTRELLMEKVGDYINYGLLFYSTVLELIEKEEKEYIESQSEIEEPLVTLVLENCEELTFRWKDVVIKEESSPTEHTVSVGIDKDAEVYGGILFDGEAVDWKKRLSLRDIVYVIKRIPGEEKQSITLPWKDGDALGETNAWIKIEVSPLDNKIYYKATEYYDTKTNKNS